MRVVLSLNGAMNRLMGSNPGYTAYGKLLKVKMISGI